MKKIVTLIFVLLFLSLSTEPRAEKAEEGEFVELFPDGKKNVLGGIEGDTMAYGKISGDPFNEKYEIILYNLTTGKERVIHSEEYNTLERISYIAPGRLSSNLIAWIERRTDYSTEETETGHILRATERHLLHLYNLITNNEEIIYETFNRIYSFAVREDRVVWSDVKFFKKDDVLKNNYTIYSYNVKTKNKEGIYSAIDTDFRPLDLYIYKDWIFWGEGAEIGTPRVFKFYLVKYNDETGEIERVLPGTGGSSDFTFSNGTLIYFDGKRRSIRGYGLENSTEFLVYENPSQAGWPIRKYGNVLLWSARGALYLYNLRAKQEYHSPIPENVSPVYDIILYQNKIIVSSEFDSIYQTIIPEDWLT